MQLILQGQNSKIVNDKSDDKYSNYWILKTLITDEML